VATSSSPADSGPPGSRSAAPGSRPAADSAGPGPAAAAGSSDAGSADAGPVEVAVVGSARIQPGDPRHDAAGRLGGLLAGQGWIVVTGGYGGLMAATARGAAAAGGRTVGLPMSGWRHLTPDASHAELRWSQTYVQRLAFLLSTSVVIALPGGIGTLAEACAVWAAAQTEPGAARLVLVGDSWKRLVAGFGAELVIDERDLALPAVVTDVDAVIPAVHRLLEVPAEVLGARG
jgi:uncharacterized protein (TIGR00725 family)